MKKAQKNLHLDHQFTNLDPRNDTNAINLTLNNRTANNNNNNKRPRSMALFLSLSHTLLSLPRAQPQPREHATLCQEKNCAPRDFSQTPPGNRNNNNNTNTKPTLLTPSHSTNQAHASFTQTKTRIRVATSEYWTKVCPVMMNGTTNEEEWRGDAGDDSSFLERGAAEEK